MKDLKALIEEHDLMDYYDKLVKITKKMIRIRTTKSDDDHIKISESKMGGDPDLPKDIQWPIWHDEPLLFLAQINLAEISKFKASEFPTKEGVLYFFYARDQDTWGFNPSDKGSWRVLYSDKSKQQLIRTSNPLENREEFEVYAPCKLAFSEDISLPYFQSTIVEQLLGDDHRYFELWEDFVEERGLSWEGGEQCNDHQLFGHSSPVQNEMELECQLTSNGLYTGDSSGYDDPRRKELEKDAYKWKLLLQIDTDDNPKWMWGDMGMLYFWIKEDDLKKNNYDDVWMILQCG